MYKDLKKTYVTLCKTIAAEINQFLHKEVLQLHRLKLFSSVTVISYVSVITTYLTSQNFKFCENKT